MDRKSLAIVAALTAVGILIACWPAISVAQQQPAPGRPAAADSPSPTQAHEAVIREELGKDTTLELSEKTLEMAVKYLAQKHRIEIILDQEATKAAGVDSSAIVSINVHGISLRSALRLMLAPLNLTYIVKDEVLKITTKDKATSQLATEVYDVRDLVTPEGGDDRDFDSIIELLTAIVSPETWSDKGGQGSCQPGPLGTLVVLQTQEIQGQISGLLAALRLANAQSKAGRFDAAIIVGESLAGKKIEMLLADQIELNLNEASLNDLVSQIGKQKDPAIQIDQEALKQAGIDPATTLVSRNISGITLRSALRLLLEEFNLTTVIKDEVLQVTTKDNAGSTLDVRLYPIGDLVEPAIAETSSNDPDAISALIDCISSTIGPESWNDHGGEGSIQPYGAGQPVLVIAQTDEVQRSVANLLARLRDVQHQQKTEAAQVKKDQPATENLVLKIYPIRNHDTDPFAMTPQEVAEAVQGLVQPGSWSQTDIYIRGFTGKLVVRQTPAIHREIDKLLDKIEAKPPKPSGGGGGF